MVVPVVLGKRSRRARKRATTLPTAVPQHDGRRTIWPESAAAFANLKRRLAIRRTSMIALRGNLIHGRIPDESDWPRLVARSTAPLLGCRIQRALGIYVRHRLVRGSLHCRGARRFQI